MTIIVDQAITRRNSMGGIGIDKEIIYVGIITKERNRKVYKKCIIGKIEHYHIIKA